MMRGLGEWKYLALLAALVVAAILEPLSFNWPESAQIIGVWLSSCSTSRCSS